MDISIIIVNYNTCEITLQCLRSIVKFTKGVDYEIILVDNASQDDSVSRIEREFPNVLLIESKENLGFGRANNLGEKQAHGKYLFLLNGDTILIENAILSMFNYMETHSEIASCGANLIDKNLQPNGSYGLFPSLKNELFGALMLHKVFKKYYLNHIATIKSVNYGDINNIDYITGADVFIRKNIFEELGGFDPNFFMYCEETDLYYRMRQKGYKSSLLPDVKIIHLQGASSKKGKKKFNYKTFCIGQQSHAYFYRKNYGKAKMRIMKIIVVFGIILHFFSYRENTCKAIKTVVKA